MAKTKSEMPAVLFDLDGTLFDLDGTLFDLDGTLIDSVYEHVQAWWSTLREAGILAPKWMIHRRVGMSGKSFVTELLREFGPKKKVNIDKLEKEHDTRIVAAISEIQPLRGADDLLKHLHRSKVRIAIATTGNRRQTSLLLKKIKVPTGMPVLTGDDAEKAKPSPDIFMAAAQRLKVQLSDCIVVGESVWDLLAAGRKVRWAWGCYRADMEKKSCIAPEHFGFILFLKICCCTWNSLAFRGSEDAHAGIETLEIHVACGC